MNTIKSAFVELTGENGFPDKVTTDYHAIDGTKVYVRLQNTEWTVLFSWEKETEKKTHEYIFWDSTPSSHILIWLYISGEKKDGKTKKLKENDFHAATIPLPSQHRGPAEPDTYRFPGTC